VAEPADAAVLNTADRKVVRVRTSPSAPIPLEESSVDDEAMRAAIEAHFTAIGRDQDEAGEIYADDAVLEYVQSGERIAGRDAIVATRKAYPGRPAAFSVERISGAGKHWAAELILRFDGARIPTSSRRSSTFATTR
jgi:hypothetical protein